MRAVLFAAVVASGLAAGAVDIPVNTCVWSGSLYRKPPASGDVTYSEGLDSVWRAVSEAAVAAKFHPQKPIGMQMVIR